jgi:hypothetical protein
MRLRRSQTHGARSDAIHHFKLEEADKLAAAS